MFSKACEYGIRAIIYIAHQSQQNKRVSLKAIAKAIDSPDAFTAKILQSLASNDIILSSKGPSGGYEISADHQLQVTLYQIVQAIDGDQLFKGCGLGLRLCNEKKPCPIHFKFTSIRQDLIAMLQDTSVGELATVLDKGVAFLKV